MLFLLYHYYRVGGPPKLYHVGVYEQAPYFEKPLLDSSGNSPRAPNQYFRGKEITNITIERFLVQL